MHLNTSLAMGTLLTAVCCPYAALPTLFAHNALVPPLHLIFLMLWIVYLVPLLIINAFVWLFGRKRVDWNRWDFAVVILPFATWLCVALALAFDSRKSSIMAEAPLLGFIVPLASILRVVVSQKADQKRLALRLLISLCVLAASLAAFMPDEVDFQIESLLLAVFGG